LFCGIARPTAVVLLLKLGENEVCFATHPQKKRPCGRGIANERLSFISDNHCYFAFDFFQFVKRNIA
jgi:hypothetical protein